MALIIEQISPTKIWIHDGSTSIMTIDTSTGVRIDSALTQGATTIPSGLGAMVVGFAGGYKISRSAAPVALDGSNPTSAAHGLTSCVAAFAQLVGSVAPGSSTSLLTCVINGANIDVYAWKPTGAALTDLIASGGTETFSWFAIGT